MNESMEFSSPIDFHDGRTLLGIANTYPSMSPVIIELIQNAVDEKATFVDVFLDYQTREMFVSDNGNGKTREEAGVVFTSISSSLKSQGQMGQFGRGFFAPLSVCRLFTFTTCGHGRMHDYNEWTFDSDALFAQRDLTSVPGRARPDLYFTEDETENTPDTTYVPWRTQIHLVDITTDNATSLIVLNDFADTIRDRFNKVLCAQKSVVSITIVNKNGTESYCEIPGVPFLGQPLNLVTLRPSDGHDVEFELYLAPRTSRGLAGKVSFGTTSDPFLIPGNGLHGVLPAFKGLITDEARKALGSGIFEGAIRSSKIALEPNRKGFVRNDYFSELGIAIEEWYDTVGKHYADTAKEEQQFERYQDITASVLSNFLTMIGELPEWQDLNEMLGAQKKLSPGEEDIEGITAEDAEPTKKKKDGAGRGGRGGRRTPKKPDLKVKIGGPMGKRHSIVEDKATGLTVVCSDMPDHRSKIYVLHPEEGCLEINVRHPLFVACDEHGSGSLRHYISQIVSHAIPAAHVFSSLDGDDGFASSMVDQVFEYTLKAQTYMTINERRLMRTAQSQTEDDYEG